MDVWSEKMPARALYQPVTDEPDWTIIMRES
jgi:hypothetical protein